MALGTSAGTEVESWYEVLTLMIRGLLLVLKGYCFEVMSEEDVINDAIQAIRLPFDTLLARPPISVTGAKSTYLGGGGAAF
jgi:hypothetical protein